ncbi:MAG: hypothetical protein RR054_02570 [Clostridia bacterium]
MVKIKEKIRNNYNLSQWIVRIIYIISVVFAEWFNLNSIVRLINTQYSLILNPYWLYVIIFGIIESIVALVFLRFAIKGIKFFGRFYTLPESECTFLLVLACIIANIAAGVMRLSYLITPLVFVWGKYLFGILSGFPAMLWFFGKLKKYYINEQTAQYMFLWIMLGFLIVNGLLTLSQGGLSI